MPNSFLFRFGQNKTRNNASRLCREKKTCFDHKKQNFLKSKKSALPKGLTHAFGQKMPFFSLLRFGQNKTTNNA